MCVLLLLVPACASGNAQTREPWVAGRVVKSDNGMPIEGATVELEQASALSSNGQNPTAITDKNGNYHFPEMTPATYRIRATADGYVWQTYSRDGTAEGQLQQLGETTHLHGIDFRLRREAVIRGILTGKKGESVGAGVFLAVVSEQQGEQGKVRLRLVDTVKTDASGRFVFTKLESGTYFVCVNGPNGLKRIP
jgi:hypothetical protein